MAPTLVGNQAVVVGAGMGGLAAAGTLVDHFEQVVVLERDTLPSDAVHRVGTPQSRHIHALLAGGQRALDELFPGFEQDLARCGAVPLRVALDYRIETPGYDPLPAARSRLAGLLDVPSADRARGASAGAAAS
jgi:2-polyprenyl-6-methoxyphenol hydroxylase-like FAD-dependent oxidoreductase